MTAICLNELANYNNGTLVYKWFYLDRFDTAAEYEEAVQEWLQSVPHPDGGQCEEWNIADSEDIPSIFVSDYSFDASKFYEYKEMRDEVGEGKLNAWLSLYYKMPESADEINDRYFGYSDELYESNGFYREIGEQLIEERGILENVPEELSNYFDYIQYGRDAYINDLSGANGFIFWNR